MKVSSKKEWERLSREMIFRDRTLRNTDIEDSDGRGKVERGPGQDRGRKKVQQGSITGAWRKAWLKKGGAVNCKCKYAEDKNLIKIKHWKMAKNFLEKWPQDSELFLKV